MIRLSGIALKLASAAGEVNILRGLDLEVAAGESVGIIGPSGSGKSTMMMIIAGLERPSAGRVEVAGEDLTALDEDQLARFRRARIGIVFQAFHLIPTMTALENVAVPLEFAGRSDAFERARSALAAVGLDHRLTHYPGQLSGGEQQRVALARGSIGRPGHAAQRVHRADAPGRGEGLLLLRARRAIEKADLDIPAQELAGIARQAGAHRLRHGADAGDQCGAEGETEKEQAESRDAAAQLAPRQPPGQR